MLRVDDHIGHESDDTAKTLKPTPKDFLKPSILQVESQFFACNPSTARLGGPPRGQRVGRLTDRLASIRMVASSSSRAIA